MRLYEKHDSGQVVERCELEDRAGTVFYVLTNPSDGDAVLEERRATAAEVELFKASREDTTEVARARAMKTFLENNPDPSTWTPAQLRTGLEWLVRVKIRELRRAGVID